MSNFDCAEKVLSIVPRSLRSIRKEITRIAKGKLTLPQYRIFVRLSQGPTTHGEIAEWLEVAPPTLSRMIGSLIKKKYLQSKPNPNDRRKLELEMTVVGKAQYTKLRTEIIGQLAKKVSGLSELEKQKLVEGLDLLAKVLLCIILAIFTFPSQLVLAANLTLDQSFDAAIRRSPDLLGQNEVIIQAEERLNQYKGAMYPSINGVGTYFVQETPTSGTAATISPPTQTTLKLTAAMPLFRGLRDFAALNQQTNLIESARATKEQLKIQIYQNMAQNFYQILSLEKDLKNFKNEIELNNRRLAELENFKKLGRSRNTEVLALESNLSTLEAQIEGTRGQLESARSLFTYLTGYGPEANLEDSKTTPLPESDVNKYLSRIESRPDVQALIKAEEAANRVAKAAWGGHLPSIDASGDYFFQRPGLLANSHWDFQVSLTLPIFQGGIIQSQVRQAASIQRQNDALLQNARMVAQQQIESLFALFNREFDQFEKQKKAVDLNMKHYLAEVHDYKLGLVTNLEVLQSLSTYQQNQRALDRALFQLKADHLKLQAAAGLKPFLGEGK